MLSDDEETIAWIGVLVILAIGCVVVLSGCLNWRGPHHPAAGSELDAIEAARAAWTAAGRPIDGCSIGIEIVEVSDRSPCLTIAEGERIYHPACSQYVQPHVGATHVLAVYLSTDLDADGRAVGLVHEVLHHLGACSTQDQDPYHEDAERWGAIQTAALARIGR